MHLIFSSVHLHFCSGLNLLNEIITQSQIPINWFLLGFQLRGIILWRNHRLSSWDALHTQWTISRYRWPYGGNPAYWQCGDDTGILSTTLKKIKFTLKWQYRHAGTITLFGGHHGHFDNLEHFSRGCRSTYVHAFSYNWLTRKLPKHEKSYFP